MWQWVKYHILGVIICLEIWVRRNGSRRLAWGEELGPQGDEF